MLTKRRYLLITLPLLSVVLNCATVTSRLPFARTPMAPPVATRPVSNATPQPDPVVETAPIPTYTPARIYRDAKWAVEMGWYSRAELAAPARPKDNWRVGDTHTFNYSDTDFDRSVKMTLRYISAHFYFWFEDDLEVAAGDVTEAAERAEADIYPALERVFGEAAYPGVDGDPRLYVLHMARLSNDNYGEYSPFDTCPVALCDESNGHDIVYLSLADFDVGSEEYLGVLAHEAQHVVLDHADGNESNWLDEGLATLAEPVSGYDKLAADFVPDFLDQPDLQLNHWPLAGGDAASYGAAYLFTLYLYERFGEDFIRALTEQPHDDLAGVEAVLQARTDLSLRQVLGDWAVANLLDEAALAEDRYGYSHAALPRLRLSDSHTRLPVEATASVHQQAADYIELDFDQPVRVTFEGSPQVALLPTGAHSGEYFWWSNRLDSSLSSLQTELDLTTLRRPVARFWMWHDLEPDWDPVMVQVSTDAGRTWLVVEGRHSVETQWWEFMYTGRSDGWVEETIDLKAWEGQTILFRIQYVTDYIGSGPGFALDDFRLESDSGVTRADDFEHESADWQAEGFVRVADTLPQQWAVHLVTLDSTPTVTPLRLDGTGQGEIELGAAGRPQRAVLIVAAIAPFTLEQAEYTYRVAPLP